MSSPPTCPSCGTPLGLFTPREISAHVNGCLDAKATETPQSARPSCAVCNRDLSLLTPAARQEHANRCADTLLPLSVTEAHPPRRRARAVNSRPALARADERVARLLQLLGLSRYAARFAGEEIDLDALILLDDADYAQLRIPDAARRRIADALHNVPLLAELRGDDPPGALSATQTQPPPVPTQRFGSSHLETRLQRGRGLLDDESSADEFPHVREEAVDKFAEAAGSKGEEDGGESPVVVHSLSPEDSNLNGEECKKPDAERHLETPEESVAIHRQDASELLLKSTDEDSEAVSSLSNFEKDLRFTSQISSEVKLEKWRQRELQRERERHEKALNDIKMKYECMKRKLEQQHAVNGAASTVTANGKVSDSTNSSTIDLTKSVEKGDPAPSTNSPRIHVHENESILISSGSGQGHNSDASAEDSLLIPDPVESPARSKAASVDGSCASPPAESDSEIMDLTCASTEKLKRSRVYGEDSSSELVEERPTATFTQRRALPSMFADDEEEEEAVTIDVTKEKAPAVAVESSVLDVSEAQEEPSRLKKRRRKVTRTEIIAGIKLDAALYDDMLSMEMVSFARIAASLKESGLVVSKKALGDFLHSEGAAFKV